MDLEHVSTGVEDVKVLELASQEPEKPSMPVTYKVMLHWRRYLPCDRDTH